MRMKFWEINREDLDRLLLVADRAMRELNDYPDDQRTLIRDLNACHSNGYERRSKNRPHRAA